GPLDRGVFVKAHPYFNRGHGDDSRPNGSSTSRLRHGGAEGAFAFAVGGCTGDILPSTLPTRSETESEGCRIVIGRVSGRAARHQRSALCSFENGSDSMAEFIIGI